MPASNIRDLSPEEKEALWRPINANLQRLLSKNSEAGDLTVEMQNKLGWCGAAYFNLKFGDNAEAEYLDRTEKEIKAALGETAGDIWLRRVSDIVEEGLGTTIV